MKLDDILGYPPMPYLRVHGGIYGIRRVDTDRIYVGQATCFFDRYGQHKTMLNRNRCPTKTLQADWNILGFDGFTFEILLSFRCEMIDRVVSRQQLTDYELDIWRQYKDNSYNIVPPRNTVGNAPVREDWFSRFVSRPPRPRTRAVQLTAGGAATLV